MAQTPSEGRRAERPGRAWSGWLAAGTFVVGLLVGALLVGLLGQDPPAAPAAQPDRPTTAGPATPPAETTGGVDETRVNAACLRAINAAQDIAATVDELGAAAAALDAARLDEVIRRLQPLQQRLREDSADCEVSEPASSSPPPATATPTPTD
ncbi:hypothetical protein [Geodermatophilus sp. SYSU D01036]